MAPRNQQASATIRTGGKTSTSEHGQRSRLLTCPAGIREPRNSPTGTALAQGSCANGADHADSLRRRHALADGQGLRSTRPSFPGSNSVKSSTACQCQPAVNRLTIATKRLTKPCKRHHLIMVIVSTVTIDPERLTVA